MVARSLGPYAEFERDQGQAVVAVHVDGVRFIRQDIAATTARGAEIRHGLETKAAVASSRLAGVVFGIVLASGVWALAIVIASVLVALN